jgi:renalase
MLDVAIIGAGIAGLVCAQQLSQAGYSVKIIEKSRGLGGRVATRRLQDTCADHGACYIKPKGEQMTRLIDLLSQHEVIRAWEGIFLEKSISLSHNVTSSPAQLRYIAPQGMSTIAKFLAQGLDIALNQRAIGVNLTSDNHWSVTLEASNEQITIIAKALVVAIPAPQALALLGSIVDSIFLDKLRSVDFVPSIAVMAGYNPETLPLPEWNAITFDKDSVLGWIGFDSRKRLKAEQPVFVVQSSADFAQKHLESEDLQSLGKQMLQIAGDSMKLDWFKTPEWMQVHRWRYAFASTPLPDSFLSADSSSPLVCCGDWCGGNLIPGAMDSGSSAAHHLNHLLERRILPANNVLDIFAK